MVDACVDQDVIDALVNDGYDVVRSPGAGARKGPQDPEILKISAEAGRILITTDAHIVIHHQAFLAEGNQHPGMIIGVQSWSVARKIETIRHTVGTVDTATLQNIWIYAQKP